MSKYGNKFWTIMIISIILFAMVSIFVARPIINDIKSKYQELGNKEKELEAVKKERDKEIEIYKEKVGIDAMYDKIYLYLPIELRSGDFVIQTENIAKSTNMSEKEITLTKTNKNTQNTQTNDSDTSTNETENKPPQAATKSSMEENPFSITLDGNFSDLTRFIEDMEMMNRYHIITSLSLSVGQENVLQAEINGSIYYKPNLTTTDASYDITSQDKNIIDGLIHFGEIITPSTTGNLNYERSEPFVTQ